MIVNWDERTYKNKCLLVLILFFAIILFIIVIFYLCNTDNIKVLFTNKYSDDLLIASSAIYDKKAYTSWSLLLKDDKQVDSVSIECESGTISSQYIEDIEYKTRDDNLNILNLQGNIKSSKISPKLQGELTNEGCWIRISTKEDSKDHIYPIL